MLVADGLPSPQGLEDRATWKLVGPVAQHRPVRHLARRGAPRSDRVEQAAGAASGQGVEVRRRRRLARRPSAEHVVSAVAEPVQQDEDDRKHARRLTPADVSGGG